MRLNLARGLIGLVILWNLQAALSYIFWPGGYSSAFGIDGSAGAAVMRGVGVLFLMWNIPYLVALWHPVRHRISLYESTAMQAIGLLGEAWISISSPGIAVPLQLAIARFIAFDALGMLLLAIAIWVTRQE